MYLSIHYKDSFLLAESQMDRKVLYSNYLKKVLNVFGHTLHRQFSILAESRMDGKAVERIPISILCTTQKTQYPIGPLTFLSLRIIFPLWLHNSCTASVHTLENKNCFSSTQCIHLKDRTSIKIR